MSEPGGIALKEIPDKEPSEILCDPGKKLKEIKDSANADQNENRQKLVREILRL